MANALEELLANSEQVTTQAAQATQAQTSEYYDLDMLWAVAAHVVSTIEGAVMYPPTGNNQLCFVSTTPPRTGGRNRRRRGTIAAKQVTIYEGGAVVFNNVAVIKEADITPQEVAAGQLLAFDAKQIVLSPAEVKNFQDIVSGKTAPPSDEDDD